MMVIVKCPICKREFLYEEGTIMLICPVCQIDVIKKGGVGDEKRDD